MELANDGEGLGLDLGGIRGFEKIDAAGGWLGLAYSSKFKS